jgi:nucleoid-associated protein YgaU
VPATVETASLPEPVATPTTYIVQPGDTLVSIARDLYDDVNMASALFTANITQLPRPDALRVGMKLRLPFR